MTALSRLNAGQKPVLVPEELWKTALCTLDYNADILNGASIGRSVPALHAW